MRRWLAALAVVTVLSGCSKPAGVDGDITDDWRPIAEASPFVPAAGACLPSQYSEIGHYSTYHRVDCAEPHYTETAFVGRFTETVEPAAGSPAMRAAYAECDRQVKTYLGDDWRDARLWLGVTVPSKDAWSGGGRWYRCDLAELDSVENAGGFRQRKGSLKGTLTGDSPLRLGCYTVQVRRGGEIGTMTPVACTAPHRAEFVGVYSAPAGPYPGEDQQKEAMLSGCRSELAEFSGVPDDGEVKFRSGIIWIPAAEEQWQAGNRGIRCYLWMDDHDLRKSMRNAGTAGLPIR
jgi:hypothetical protein